MRRLVMRRLVAALAGTVLTWGIAASPAVAAAPERYTDHFEETDTIDCSEFDPAWTFNDDFVDVFDIRGQVWLNDAGQPVRALEHIVHRSTDVNSVTGTHAARAQPLQYTDRLHRWHRDRQRGDQYHAAPRGRQRHPERGSQGLRQ